MLLALIICWILFSSFSFMVYWADYGKNKKTQLCIVAFAINPCFCIDSGHWCLSSWRYLLQSFFYFYFDVVYMLDLCLGLAITIVAHKALFQRSMLWLMFQCFSEIFIYVLWVCISLLDSFLDQLYARFENDSLSSLWSFPIS